MVKSNELTVHSEDRWGGETPSQIATKRAIWEKVRRRMTDLQERESHLCAELNPDVIVISGDQSFLFEPQNLKVTEWLRRHFRMENLGIRDQLRVHPAQSGKTVMELKAAGFEVV
jgi:hypothetical protein